MTDEFDIEKVTDLLRQLREALPERPKLADGLSPRKTNRLRDEVELLLGKLSLLAEGLDPISRPDFIFDPSNPEFVGKLIGRTLIEQPRNPLGKLPKFYGSGVYAIYYTGTYPAYRPIRNKETPIYVGKADPPTPEAKTVVEQGPKLCARLGEHAKSVRTATSTLNDYGEVAC